jgi:hypothetical protein
VGETGGHIRTRLHAAQSLMSGSGRRWPRRHHATTTFYDKITTTDYNILCPDVVAVAVTPVHPSVRLRRHFL